jgi:thymidylate synthase (FAD)
MGSPNIDGSVPGKGYRPSSPALDDLLGKAVRVLDDGFVRVADYMGTDASIVQAARVSYGEGTRKVHEDRGLIRYLMRHRHTTPFEMCEIKLHIRVPMDVWRQWIRHRTANVNEYSTRYSIAIDAAQRTAAADWRLQASTNRQGSEGSLTNRDAQLADHLTKQEQLLQEHARAVYEERLKHGVAREQARKDLPLSTYTEAYWKIDLHNLLHFLSLRMDHHAQHEIRQYACLIGHKIVAAWCPLTWQAFQDYRLDALTFSAPERAILKSLTASQHNAATTLAQSIGWLEQAGPGQLKPNRERKEFEAKLAELGLTAPWDTPTATPNDPAVAE